MDIEFKEKTFEKYFGHELARLTNVTFSPDQCDEALLGFDEAFLVPKDWFLRYGPYVRRRRVGRLSGADIKSFNLWGAEISKHLPPFKFNLIVQFKRPKFLKSPGAKEWADWKQPYYRYETMAHQQKALECIDAQSHGRAATIYASPAFWRAGDLWAHVEQGAVIDNSNMASVGKLKGHDHYSYAAPGCVGKGHSETSNIDSEPLRKIVETGLEVSKPLRLDEHLKKTAETIRIAISDSSDDMHDIFRRVQTSTVLERGDRESLYDAMVTIEIFSEAFGVRLYAMGDPIDRHDAVSPP